jgi:hypothetical protein
LGKAVFHRLSYRLRLSTVTLVGETADLLRVKLDVHFPLGEAGPWMVVLFFTDLAHNDNKVEDLAEVFKFELFLQMVFIDHLRSASSLPGGETK